MFPSEATTPVNFDNYLCMISPATNHEEDNTREDNNPVLPMDDNPIDDNPMDDNPIDDNPIDDNPIDDNPIDEISTSKKPKYKRRKTTSIRDLVDENQELQNIIQNQTAEIKSKDVYIQNQTAEIKSKDVYIQNQTVVLRQIHYTCYSNI